MPITNKIVVVSCLALLASATCSAAALAQQDQSSTETPAQTGSQPPTASSTTTTPPGTPSVPSTPTTTTGQPPGVVPAANAGDDPATYVPKTEFDNTPWRFNMEQNGKRMSAEEFDQWMKSRGVRVATGKPATPPAAQTCPTPDGDRGDSDGDGIINCLDLCPDSQPGQTVGPDGCPVPVSIDLEGVIFAYDKATLSKDAKGVLDVAMQILKEHDGLKVEVAGHTDARGDAAYNQKLSERRAKAVYDYLVGKGIAASRLIGPIGYGESRPIAPNTKPNGSDNPEGRAKNRRTELNIQN